jgi:glycosyltransferase involved in cell wall biosynthesis
METSVIIPAYNQGRYLGAAIRSVLEQTHQDFEIIVVDDGSTDDTRAVAHAFTDPRLRYVYQENRGLSAARNTGIRHAQGRYISYLDSDDQFLPVKLALLTEESEREPLAGLVAGQAIPVDDEGHAVGRIFDRPLPDDPAQLLLGNPLHVGSVLVCREWQERAGFFDETLRSYEDWDMWLRLARLGCPMRSVTEPVSLYRFHGAQMTRIGAQMTTATFAVLDKAFADPALPEAWRLLKDRAYSRANLRAAAQAYLAGDYAQGAECVSQAVALDPSLAAGGGEPLAKHFAAWIELPKTRDPLGFLEAVYLHLPPELGALRARREAELGRAAMQIAFAAYAHRDMTTARRTARAAFRHDPRWLSNGGAVAVLIRSHLNP